MKKYKATTNIITFYHDIEQDIDSGADQKECLSVVKKFLRLEKKYGISATYNIVGKLFKEQPDMIELILREGQEVAFHSYSHSCLSEDYSKEISLCREISSMPHGYRSPKSQWNQTTLQTLWEKGFRWNAESDMAKEPYFIYKGLVRLPIAADDWPLYTGTLSADMWINQFFELMKSRSYFAFGSHDFVMSSNKEKYLKAWQKVLQIAVQNNASILNFSETANQFRCAKLLEYYSSVASEWNHETIFLYRTKRFQEMIRNEVEKLNRPVIADLGSGSGALSSHLKDLAQKIYCVDNAPGMLANVDLDKKFRIWHGEVTNSKLADNSIDFIICARVIEYLFWPDRLIDEIIRIGKKGTVCFITFPALQEGNLLNRKDEDNIPDRIRYYFTFDEIRNLTKRIGTGRIIGIQYDKKEPRTPDEEKKYRDIEKNPPQNTCPTNWVYIGTIKKEPAKTKFLFKIKFPQNL